MKQTPNINLPILEQGDKYLKETQNEAFSVIDREIAGLNSAISVLDNVEGSIIDTKSDVETLKNETNTLKSSLNDMASNVIPTIQSSLDNNTNKINNEVFVSDFKTNNNSWNEAVNLAINSVSSGTIVLPKGNIEIITPIKIKSNITLRGFGSSTILKPIDCHCITTDLNVYINTVVLKDFSIVGNNEDYLNTYDNNCNGININTGSSDSFKIKIENITIQKTKGKGVYIPNGFNIELNRVFINNCGGNGIELSGGPSTQLSNCYIHSIGKNKVGYRVYSEATLICCNGVDRAEYWGVFGATGTQFIDSSIGNRQYQISLINCNIEDFEDIGVQFLYSGRFNITTCNFLAHSTTPFNYYIKADNTNGCYISNDSTFNTKGGVCQNPSPFRFSNNYNILSFNPSILKADNGDGTTTKLPSITFDYTYLKRWLTIEQMNIKNMNYYYHDGKKRTVGSNAPTSGTYNQGDIVYNANPSTGGYIGWVCTASGTPGTWKSFGLIS